MKSLQSVLEQNPYSKTPPIAFCNVLLAKIALSHEELEVAHVAIENAINIPIQVLEGRIDELKPFKDKEIFVICRTQNRSAVAVDMLIKNGYNAKNVLGGMSVFYQK